MNETNTVFHHYTLEEIVGFIKHVFNEVQLKKSYHNNFFSDCSLSEGKVYLRPKPCLKFDAVVLKEFLKDYFPEGTTIDVTCFLIVIQLPPLDKMAKIIEKAFHNADANGFYEDKFLSAAKMERGKFFIESTIRFISDPVATKESLLPFFEKGKYKLMVTIATICIYKTSTL